MDVKVTIMVTATYADVSEEDADFLRDHLEGEIQYAVNANRMLDSEKLHPEEYRIDVTVATVR